MLKSSEFETYVCALYKKRKDWHRVAVKYGAKQPEDVLQDAFIKLLEWRTRNPESKYNDGLFFFIVRNTALDEARKTDLQSELTDNHIIEDYEQHYTDAQVEVIQGVVSSFHWFDAKLVDVYFGLSRATNGNLSMRELAKETGISTSTIYTTIKRCKQRIKEAVDAVKD